MRPIDEGYLRFEFGPEWDHVEQWDRTKDFSDGIHRVQGVRALDIIALSKTNKECLLIEVKDFRDQNNDEAAALARRRARKPQKRSSPRADEPSAAQIASRLIDQVAHKVVGTIAGLTGTARTGRPGYSRDFADYLTAHKSNGIRLRVVLWIEGRPTSEGLSPRAKSNLGMLNQSLKRKMSWLTVRPIMVLSSASEPDIIPGVRVVDRR